MKNLKSGIWAVSLVLLLASCKNDKKTDADSDAATTPDTEVKNDQEKPKLAYVNLEARSGTKAMGKAEFKEQNGVVSLYAEIINLEPGTHAIHIHEFSDCSAEDGSSAGGHWNPTFEKHGKWGDPEGYHRGDIGNFTADENGKMVVKFETDQWCIDCDDPTKNIVGKSIIVHTDPDDYVSQPTGNAGGRVSCGGIIK